MTFGATISTIAQNKLVLNIIEYLIDGDKLIIVVELVDGWEVSVLLAWPYWHVRL